MHGSDIILLAWDDDVPPAGIVDNGSSYTITPGGDLLVADAGTYYVLDDPTPALPTVADAGTYLTITN